MTKEKKMKILRLPEVNFKDAEEADAWARHLGGRLIGKETYWVGEIDPYSYKRAEVDPYLYKWEKLRKHCLKCKHQDRCIVCCWKKKYGHD